MSTEKPSNTEDEYFARENAERLRKLHHEEQRRLQKSDREDLRKLHAGRCSSCGALMVPEQAGGVRLLHCPACGGAFLDKAAWSYLQAHEEPHTVMGAVLNWFKAANKP
ncbi:MAG TPA: zf-TFIIB domain-containing protein [Myxococcales bacterium]|nr:zf-TFIIB domain-containing protein [Myxococcales bacterium]